MRGLVLKILKGTYPPIPNQYSNDLKMLIAEMLIKDPAKRPSIKKILDKEFLKVCIISIYIYIYFTINFTIYKRDFFFNVFFKYFLEQNWGTFHECTPET